MPPLIDLTGMKFTRLTVIKQAPRTRHMTEWECVCECDPKTVVIVQGVNLKSGATRSCGCFKKDNAAANATKHGMIKSPEYRVWCHMIGRCHNPTDAGFKWYGERGIVVCEKWRESFGNFFADIGAKPSVKHQIDRFPNNNGNYEPGNVRWATKSQNQRNKRNNRILTVNGESMSLIEWAERTGINAGTIKSRLKKGLSVELALTLPVRRFHVLKPN